MRTIDIQEMQRHLPYFAESVYNGEPACLVCQDGITTAVLLGSAGFFVMLEMFSAYREEGGGTVH